MLSGLTQCQISLRGGLLNLTDRPAQALPPTSSLFRNTRHRQEAFPEDLTQLEEDQQQIR